MPIETSSIHSDSKTYVTAQRYRTFDLTITILLWIWMVVAGVIWLVERESGYFVIAALLFAISGLLRTYAVFQSRLVLSAKGVRYVSFGATFFAPWEIIQLKKRRFLWRTREVLSLAYSIKPGEKTMFAKVVMPRPISSIPLQPFGWPDEVMRADFTRYAPQLFEGD